MVRNLIVAKRIVPEMVKDLLAVPVKKVIRSRVMAKRKRKRMLKELLPGLSNLVLQLHIVLRELQV